MRSCACQPVLVQTVYVTPRSGWETQNFVILHPRHLSLKSRKAAGVCLVLGHTVVGLGEILSPSCHFSCTGVLAWHAGSVSPRNCLLRHTEA